MSDTITIPCDLLSKLVDVAHYALRVKEHELYGDELTPEDPDALAALEATLETITAARKLLTWLDA